MEDNIMKKVGVGVAVLSACLILAGCSATDYKSALKTQNEGKYEAAAKTFKNLDDYKDSGIRAEFCEAAASLFDKNSILDKAISDGEANAKKNDNALNNDLKPALENAITQAKKNKVKIKDMPTEKSKVKAIIDEMKVVDYSSALTGIKTASDALDKSRQQYALVDVPDESYVISCLKTVPNITSTEAATEDNDPNDHLNKKGGYTSDVYFSSDLVDKDELFSDSVIANGTDGGGSIEVYKTEKDAKAREKYISRFDGGVLSAGTHKVVGTVLIRTSEYLNATQQVELEANIEAALTKLPE